MEGCVVVRGTFLQSLILVVWSLVLAMVVGCTMPSHRVPPPMWVDDDEALADALADDTVALAEDVGLLDPSVP